MEFLGLATRGILSRNTPTEVILPVEEITVGVEIVDIDLAITVTSIDIDVIVCD